MIAPELAAGRVLHAAVSSPADWPPADCAACDGYAIRAADSEGAGDYNPVRVRTLPVPAGAALPPGMDAVLPAKAVRQSLGGIDVFSPVARGECVVRRASELRAGDRAIAAGRRLRPQDVGLLALLGVGLVVVVRRPCVHLRVAGNEAVAPMLAALIARDGGVASEAGAPDGADLLLVAGVEADDVTLAMRGVAMRPGAETCVGALGGVPALLLPGPPLDCLAAYDLLAARAVRQMAGLPPSAYRIVEAEMDRKIVSVLGLADQVRVRLAGGRAIPLGAADAGGLASAVRADGFVLVAESSEGCAPGSRVRVHLYDDQDVEVSA